MLDKPSTRRSFLGAVSSFATVLSWHPPSDAFGLESPAAPEKKAHQAARFRFLQLQAKNLQELREFYTKTLGVPQQAETENSCTLVFGETLIEFRRAAEGQEPFYHFAFNIAENKFRKAKEWLRTRCLILNDNLSGADELFFRDWNAHAVYFADPSGNIVELIARHNLPNASNGEFGVCDILYVSEIGLVAPKPDLLVAGIDNSFGLKPYLGDKFFVGDEYGLFVLPRVDRPWIPERRQKAAVFSAQVTIAGRGAKVVRAPGLPYVIRREA